MTTSTTTSWSWKSVIAIMLVLVIAILLVIALVTLVSRCAPQAQAPQVTPVEPVVVQQAPVAPVVVQQAPVAQAAPATSPGTRIELFGGRIILIHSGVGNICSVTSSVYWYLPVGTSADIQGVKYFSGTPVPPAMGTFFDCHRSHEIRIASETAESMPAELPKPEIVCSIVDPLVENIVVLDSSNGQAMVAFRSSGSFHVPEQWDLDYEGTKFGRTGVSRYAEVSAGTTGTLWAPQECKPLR